MRKLHTRLVLLLMVLALAAAACGGGGAADESTADGGVPSPEAEAGLEEGAEGETTQDETEDVVLTMEPDPDDPGENVELEFWTFVENHADFLIQQAQRFNEQNDEFNIILNATSASFEEMHDRLLIALQSGVGAPDIVDIEIQRFATYLRGDPPLHPLTDVIEPYRDQLVEERLAPYETEGEAYGFDYHLGAFLMYYNTEIMEEAGVDPTTIVTWDDYIAAGQQVVENTDALMAPVEIGDRFSILGPMLQNGGGTYNEAGEPILDSPENVEAVEMVSSMVNEHEIAGTVQSVHDPGFFEAFNNDEYASIWMPQWYMIRFVDQMPDTEGKILVQPLPAFEEGGTVSTMGGGTGTAVTEQIDEQYVDLAKEFLAFAKLTEEAQISIWTDLGFDPYRQDVYDAPELTEPDPFFANEESAMSVIQSTLDRLAPEFTGPRYPEAINLLNEVVAFDVISEGRPAEEVLAGAQEEILAFGD